jgi:hypothetical protein
MNYQTSQSKNGLIYHIADGVKVVPKVNGYWYLDVYQKGDRIRRNFEKGEDGLRKALEVGELMAAKLGLTRTHLEEEKPKTLSDVAAQWITSNKQRWTPATLERYAEIVNGCIEPKFGMTPLAKVTRNSIKDFLADVLAVRSAKTVEVTFAVFSGIFNEAIDRGYMHENPVSGLLKKVLPPKRKLTQPMAHVAQNAKPHAD